MLSLLAAGAYLLGQNTARQDSDKQLPNINFDKSQAVLREIGRPPGLLHTDFQERATFSNKDPSGLRAPYGGNPQSGTINLYGITTSLEYQEQYQKNLQALQRDTVHWTIDPAFNSPLNNYTQQGHQISMPGVQLKMAARYESLNPRNTLFVKKLTQNHGK